MSRNILPVILIAVTFACCVFAQETNDVNTMPLSTIEDYLRYAEAHNAGLKSSFEQWKAALEQLPQARALPDPMVEYGYYTQQPDTGERQMFSVKQTFPWFGKIEARTDAAAADADAAKKKYDAARLKLFQEVKDAFYEYAYLARAVAIAADNLELLKHFEQVARTKYMAAAATHPDLIRAQVQMAGLEDVLKSLEQLRQPTVARLNAVLNRPIDANLAWPVRYDLQPVQLNRQLMLDMVRQKNPELAGLSHESQAARSRIELAKKNYFPDIGVGVEWVQMERSGDMQEKGKDPVLLMFSMNLPLWRDSYRAAERQARAEARKIEQEKIDTENTILARARQVLYEYEDSARKIQLYRDTLVPKADELLSASETAYAAGTIDFLSLIDAQQSLLQYHLAYERSLADNRQRLAELEMLVGTDLQQP